MLFPRIKRKTKISTLQQIRDVTAVLEPRLKRKVEVVVVLGSGLGGFVQSIENPQIIPYSEIPHFEKTSVEGHEGRIVFGEVNGVYVAALQGRWHFYEGHSMTSIVLPVRAMCTMGAHTLILTNASGGLNPSFHAGDLMIIDDHINLMGDNPLTGKEPATFGPRFPDMSEPYCQGCIEILEKTAKAQKLTVKKGVYLAVRGPTYETPAEVRMFRILGADAVGMSTVPETIAARHLGVRVVGLSCITNLAAGMDSKKIDHKDVQKIAQQVMKNFSALLAAALPHINASATK